MRGLVEYKSSDARDGGAMARSYSRRTRRQMAVGAHGVVVVRSQEGMCQPGQWSLAISFVCDLSTIFVLLYLTCWWYCHQRWTRLKTFSGSECFDEELST